METEIYRDSKEENKFLIPNETQTRAFIRFKKGYWGQSSCPTSDKFFKGLLRVKWEKGGFFSYSYHYNHRKLNP